MHLEIKKLLLFDFFTIFAVGYNPEKPITNLTLEI